MDNTSSNEKQKWPRRRTMREVIFKILFSFDSNRISDEQYINNLIVELLSEQDIYDRPLTEEAHEYIRDILRKQDEIDDIIKKYLFNWDWNRIASVDKNVLRLGIYELLFKMKIPVEVTMNEAVEIAKRYGTDKSSKFVNGVLDSVSREMVPKEKLSL
ncbi:MAG TPA: transcription antitermination factor NusB [Thermotogota bacterium]|nr:transcription antitermination factor NusB [Thermotogota bacterium]HPJ88530.1 transcription antitermination factor NusB [Thermotogota bacterium]HPR96464.1 transcription antitermination factor NusB [Thermotogota bacterium]